MNVNTLLEMFQLVFSHLGIGTAVLYSALSYYTRTAACTKFHHMVKFQTDSCPRLFIIPSGMTNIF